MTSGKAVRLPAELHAALSARVDAHGTIASQVEEMVRAGLKQDEVDVTRARRRARQSPTRALPVRIAAPRTEPCRHPVGRQIGKLCAECGAAVRVTKSGAQG